MTMDEAAKIFNKHRYRDCDTWKPGGRRQGDSGLSSPFMFFSEFEAQAIAKALED